MVPIAVLGQFAVDPTALGALKAVQQGPFIVHKGLGAVVTDRDYQPLDRNRFEAVFIVTMGNGNIVSSRVVFRVCVRAMVQLAVFFIQVRQ